MCANDSQHQCHDPSDLTANIIVIMMPNLYSISGICNEIRYFIISCWIYSAVPMELIIGFRFSNPGINPGAIHVGPFQRH
jgi:hypothetical protein